MADNFDLRKYLAENKLTSNSKLNQEEINEADKITNAVDDMLEKWMLELGEPHPNAPNRSHYPFFETKPAQGWWTRGDGKRYKSPPYIAASKSTMPLEDRLKDKDSPIKNETDLMNWLWEKLKAQGKEFQIAGPHGSDEPSPAVKIGDYIFILNDSWGKPTISYSTRSILKNAEIWRS